MTYKHSPCPGQTRLKTHSIQLPQIPPPCKVRTETSLGTARRNAAERSEHTGGTQQDDAAGRAGQGGRETVEDHGGVVEDVGGEAVPFAFGLQARAELVGEGDRGESARALLEDGEQEGGCWGRGCVADSDSCSIVGRGLGGGGGGLGSVLGVCVGISFDIYG